MSRITTRLGPVKINGMVLSNGNKVATISDTKDETLFMVVENMPFLRALEWAAVYVQYRYSMTTQGGIK